jgi:hypothetical protein
MIMKFISSCKWWDMRKKGDWSCYFKTMSNGARKSRCWLDNHNLWQILLMSRSEWSTNMKWWCLYFTTMVWFLWTKKPIFVKPLQGCEGHTINLFECSGQWPVANIQVWQIRSFHLFNKMTLLLASFSWPSCNNDRLKESWYKLEGVTEVCNVKVSWMNNSWEIKMPMTGTFLSCI